jgi:hypothetical protein
MALAKRNYVYVDFTSELVPPVHAKATHAIATAADTQEDYLWVGGTKYFEYVQIGASTLLFPAAGAAGIGWTLPLDNTDADGLEITRGIIAGKAQSFVVGSAASPGDAFFVQAVLGITTRAGADVVMVGLRRLGVYVPFATPAAHLAAYDDKAAIGVYTNAGAFATHTSLNNSDLQTALAKAAAADTNRVALRVDVSAAGVVTYQIGVGANIAAAKANMAADANAVAFTFDATDVLVPYVGVVATGGGAAGVILEEFEAGVL